MRILFIGTPDYAIPSLEGLINAGHTIVGVLCQEDKPVGRKRILTSPPIKIFAESHHIPVLQPIKVSDANQEIKTLHPDIFVVVAFGKLIPQSTLDLSVLPPINAHASLLPKFRGAAPAGRAIMAGETKTGISVMRVVKELDAGPVMLVKEIDILPNMTRFELLDELSKMSPIALIDALNLLHNNEAKFIEQNHNEYTYAPKIVREDGALNWHKTADELYNQFRGVSPFPGAFGKLHITAKSTDIVVKIEEVEVVRQKSNKPGCIIKCENSGIVVGCGKDSLKILKLKPQGKRQMGASDFINGYRLANTDYFILE